jgi:hypothetical protein
MPAAVAAGGALRDRALPAIRDEGGVEPSGSGHAAAVKLRGASAEDLDDVGLLPIAAPH